MARLMATQIALARALPDYWQRFDVVRSSTPRSELPHAARAVVFSVASSDCG